MSQEERELLQRSVELAEENNTMLRAIKRSMRFGRIVKIIYWTVIIGTAVGAFYFMQPYIDSLVEAYGGAKNSFDSFSSVFK